MTVLKHTINWSARAKLDVKHIYLQLLDKNSKSTSQKIRDEILKAPESIIFAEQFQVDEYLEECRRIIVRNYKILYSVQGTTISIISVFNSYSHPSKMKA